MNKKQTVLSFIRQKGPSIPGWINKEVELDILMTSALMAELVFNKELLISTVKIGGSPLYYIKGQESALVNYLDKLHEKEKRAVLVLKEKLVLRDNILDPLIRVALRQTKDFAKPFTVNINGKKELFWKWFLINDSELIRKKVYNLIGGELKKKKPEHSNQPEQLKQEKQIREQPKSENREIERNKSNIQNKSKEKHKNLQSNTSNQKNNENINLGSKLENELKKLRIDVLSSEVIKKSKEFDMVITLPSTVGRLKYFCKYLDKKKINDKDISSAFVKGQMEKLPVLVIITGELNKKAEKILEDIKGVFVKQI